METIRGSMEMAQSIILRTLPLLGSPGIERKPLNSTVVWFQQSRSPSVLLFIRVSVDVGPALVDLTWTFDLSPRIFFSHHAHS